MFEAKTVVVSKLSNNYILILENNNLIITHFRCSYIIFADCKYVVVIMNSNIIQFILKVILQEDRSTTVVLVKSRKKYRRRGSEKERDRANIHRGSEKKREL